MTSDRRTDLVVAGIEAGLVAAAVVTGAVLNGRAVRLYADAAPLFAIWRPHVGWGTPLAVALAAAIVLIGPGWARTAPWRLLLAVGYLAALVWTFSLALVDGWSAGLATRLTPQGEYLQEVHRVTDIPATLAGFTDGILDFQAGSWATHVAGHPPGALLAFVWLDRI
jgi:methylthioxylose transferase